MCSKLLKAHRLTLKFEKKVSVEEQKEKERIRSLAYKHKTSGYPMLLMFYRKYFGVMNHKKFYRIYTEEGLKIRLKTRRKKFSGQRQPLVPADGMNRRWSMDFVHDSFDNGKSFRVLNVIDDFARKAICIYPEISIPSRKVIDSLEQAFETHGRPESIVCDNGPEFRSNKFQKWASENKIILRFIEKGKPTQNAFVESFNGKFRNECLNANIFRNLSQTKLVIEDWRKYYNTERPHSSLYGLTPTEYESKTVKSKD